MLPPPWTYQFPLFCWCVFGRCPNFVGVCVWHVSEPDAPGREMTWELDAVSKACKRCDGRSVLQRGRSSTETWECLANIRWSWFQARRCSYARSSDPSLADPLALRLGDNASHVLIQELACAYPQILVAVPVLVLCTTDLGCQLLGGCLATLV